MRRNQIETTAIFDQWLANLKDKVGKANILSRLERAELGHFGDCESVGDGVSEMRIHAGPGYRVYFVRRGQSLYVLLAGGDKSTQPSDIKMARQLANQL